MTKYIQKLFTVCPLSQTTPCPTTSPYRSQSISTEKKAESENSRSHYTLTEQGTESENSRRYYSLTKQCIHIESAYVD